MKPRELIDTAEVPNGPPLRLVRHDRDFIIMLDRNELMSTRMNGSETALGAMTCARLRSLSTSKILVGGYGMGFTLRAVLAAMGKEAEVIVAELVPGIIAWARGPLHTLTDGCLDDHRVAMTCARLRSLSTSKILVGGYGMGFTLRAVLAAVGREAKVTVAELVPGIIAWARGPLHTLTDGCLDDDRVAVVIGDVADVLATGVQYDAILLDVDNGPEGATRKQNNGLYGKAGLTLARRALRPGGILAVWSAGSDAAFAHRLERAGFDVEEVRVAARSNGKGPRHTIWFATAA